MEKIIVERVVHDGVHRLTLKFPYSKELVTVLREINGAKWSARMNCWHIPDAIDAVSVLLAAFRGIAYVDYSALKGKKIDAAVASSTVNQGRTGEVKRIRGQMGELSVRGKSDLEAFRRWLEAHRYPSTTVRTYTGMIDTFLRFVSPKEADECTSDELVRLVDEYILPAGLSHSYQNQMVSAVKKFYGEVYRSVIDPGKLTRPRPQHRLPNVLSKEEVKRVLEAPLNEKHRVMLSLIYSCGLRRSELIALVPADIERERKLLRVRESKGFKDRVITLSEKVTGLIDAYLTRYKPEKYLFEGQYRGTRYSTSSLDKVFKDAAAKAGLNRDISLHGLRHSYATHLLESGTDIRYIQELLGHKSSRTTEIYTHVTTQSIQKIRSPFDDL